MSAQEEKCHFDLKLNCKTADAIQLKFRITVLLLHNIKDELSPLQMANRNLLGVLYFYLGEHYQAYEQFLCVLNNDPKNLNALRNIIRVCNTIIDSSVYASKLKILKNNPDQRVLTRCKAEHAYAHAFDTYNTTNELLRYHESIDLYDECLKETSKLLQPADEDFQRETAEWLLCKIWNYKKVFNRNYLLDRSSDRNERMHTDILETIFKIRELVPNDTFLQSISWGYLGYFFWKIPVAPNYDPNPPVSESSVPKIVCEKEMNKYFNNPELCFKEAGEESVEVLQLYMGWLNEEKRFDEGIKKLDICIKLVPKELAESNYFSYSKRGELLLQKCTSGLENAWNNQTKDSWNKDMEQAIDDLEFAANVNPTSYLYGYLVSAYCLAYTGTGDETKKIKCLFSYRTGLKCLDGKSDSTLHFKHAQCLKTLKQHDMALCVIQRSVESQNAKTTFVEDIKMLLDWMIEKYTKSSANENQDEQIFIEMAFWFYDVAFTKYQKEALKRMFETFLTQQYNKDADRLYKFLGQIYLKNDLDLNQFTIDCLGNVDTNASHELNLLAQFLKKMCITTPVNQKILLKSSDLTPKNTSGYEYDFYVISSPKDKDWVQYSLVSHLENCKNFKGFIDDRDSKLGRSILTNVDDAIRKCFKFIVVISPNFQESRMCTYEAEAAFLSNLDKKKKIDSVIPIVKDDADVPAFLKTIKPLYVCDLLIKNTMFERIAEALDRE